MDKIWKPAKKEISLVNTLKSLSELWNIKKLNL
jgi:hypothetical protein